MTTPDVSTTMSPFRNAFIAADGPRMLLTTFSILALELAMIRWVGTQIRVAAYFSNLVLIACFLGIGLGVAIGARRPQWFAATLPILAVVVGVLAFAEPLGIVRFQFPDPAVHLWGAETEGHTLGFIIACMAVLTCFWAIAAVFVGVGLPLGWLFSRMEPLRAYRWDIAGSLLGVVVMSLAAWAETLPPIWFAIAIAPLLLLRRSWFDILLAVVIVAAAAYSVSGAVFSPYNRIDIAPATSTMGKSVLGRSEWKLSVNRDYHQFMLDLSRPSDSGVARNETRERVRAAYEVPFRVTDRRASAMVVGAGTGNDVAAALRTGFERVLSVDIDPQIIALGRALHPERPYDDPRVVPVVNDARAWFEQHDELFDVVCYGLLDSHAMFSAMSTLRLDNYVYTIEGVRAGWAHVAPDGVLSISFSVLAGEWMTHRLVRLVRAATGIEPIVVDHGYNYGVTFLVGYTLTIGRVVEAFARSGHVAGIDSTVRIPTDDWPFLYLRPNTVPNAYIAVVVLIALTGLLAVRAAFGNALVRSRFDGHMFLLGAGFMLLQARMVTELSLLFGSTWIVNSCVIAGILVMIILANTVVERFAPRRIELVYIPLALSLLLIWIFSAGVLNRFDLLPRALLAGFIYALPVFFAGLIFSTSLKRARDASAALGANLCGAVFGGLLEYLSMAIGMKALVLLTLALYLGSLLLLRRDRAAAAISHSRIS